MPGRPHPSTPLRPQQGSLPGRFDPFGSVSASAPIGKKQKKTLKNINNN